jgi:hypothetical protein
MSNVPTPPLNPQQQPAVLVAMREYLHAQGKEPGRTLVEEEDERNAARVHIS